MRHPDQFAEIEDPNGTIYVTVTKDVVTIKQGNELIRLKHSAARELSADLDACLKAFDLGRE